MGISSPALLVKELLEVLLVIGLDILLFNYTIKGSQEYSRRKRFQLHENFDPFSLSPQRGKSDGNFFCQIESAALVEIWLVLVLICFPSQDHLRLACRHHQMGPSPGLWLRLAE